MSAKGKTVSVAILASLLALTSCSDDEQVRVNDEETRASAAPRVGAEWTIDQTAGESTADEPAGGLKEAPKREPGTTPFHAQVTSQRPQREMSKRGRTAATKL